MSFDFVFLNGNNGFRLDGVAAGNGSGYSVASAGDVNGDGYADLIVGTKGAGIGTSVADASYVVFGKSSGFDPAINLSTLSGSDGFKLTGGGGVSVASAGDVNPDGA